jgi:hypothetical protein
VVFSYLIVSATTKVGCLLDNYRDMSSENSSFTSSEVDFSLGGGETIVVSG